MSNAGFVNARKPIPTSVLELSPLEQQAKDAGAKINEYIAHICNGRSHEEAVELAGGKI